ncbi:hypothetical protein [Methylomagnum ishizawai]|uniref:hypothetical protein n=1 Tax=Methylomagnum ishizawai TaxID=1760988 RepID=UPI001C335499|nr:hypothetical protein [Methylomagnum ishizawai]BBL75388.1 hypothetical protein MishRS11D_24860 [Methylomagnum ishizawai]
MSAIQGTHVAAPIVPGDTADIFPSHVDIYGQGGYRAVADDAARDAIPAPRRSAGMLIWHGQDQLFYRLDADLATWLPAFDFIPAPALDTDSTMAANSDSRVPSQKAVKTALDLKLDASAYNDRFKGLYSTLSALQAARPTGAAGDYAQVDSGLGGAPHIYSWDVSDDAWALTSAGGTGAANTDQLPEGSTHLYFTAARAVAACTGVFQAASGLLTALAGLSGTGWLKFTSGTPSVAGITASDVSGLGSAATRDVGAGPGEVAAGDAPNAAVAAHAAATDPHGDRAYADAIVAAKAPLASPALTGIPTAPTAALGANTNQVATMAAVKAAIDALVAGAPGALDTLDEIATQLANDESAVAALTAVVADKQPLDATLTALAALVTAADRLVYADGVDSFATTDLTAFGRTLAGLANVAALKTLLGLAVGDIAGLGSAATHAADDFATAAQAAALAGYDLPFCFEGSPGAGARLAAILLVRPVWLPFDLDGSIFRVDGAAGDYALAVQHLRDGEVLVAGTATLHPDGTATLALDGDVDGQPGDELWISAPATPDAGVTSVRGTIKAEAVLP